MSSNPPSPSSVYPRIKAADFLRTVEPMLDEIEARGGDSGLLVTYTLDTPTQFIALTNEGMASLGLTPEELIAMHPDREPSRRACLGALSLTMLLASVAGCASSRGTSNDDASAANRPRRDEWNEREAREKWQEEKRRDDEYKSRRESSQREKEQQMQAFKEQMKTDAKEQRRIEADPRERAARDLKNEFQRKYGPLR